MAQAIQPINRNYLPFQRSLQQQQAGSFKQWLSDGEPGNDAAPEKSAFEVFTRPKTSLEDLLLLQQENGVVNNSFAPHLEQKPYEATAVPSDIADDGQYLFEFLAEALPEPGDKLNREI